MGAGIIFGLGYVVGSIVVMIIFRLFLVGVLRVDTSDPDGTPYLFLELKKGVDSISKKQYVMLRVSRKNFISHK